MDLNTILLIVSGALTVAAAVFGTKYTNIKKAAKETVDVAIAVISAWEDDKVTQDETDKIVKESKEALESYKAIFKKKG